MTLGGGYAHAVRGTGGSLCAGYVGECFRAGFHCAFSAPPHSSGLRADCVPKETKAFK